MISKCIVLSIHSIRCLSKDYNIILLRDATIRENMVFIIEESSNFLGHLYKMCPYNSLHFPHINNYDHHVNKCQKYCIRKEGGDVDLLAEMRATLASQNKDAK